VTNRLKDVRAELAQIIYEQPIYPKNRYIDKRAAVRARRRREKVAAFLGR
jgi:beta-ureidopropionase